MTSLQNCWKGTSAHPFTWELLQTHFPNLGKVIGQPYPHFLNRDSVLFVLPLLDIRETARCLKLIGIGVVDFVRDYHRARQYRVLSRKSPQGIKERLLLGRSEEVGSRQSLINRSNKQGS